MVIGKNVIEEIIERYDAQNPPSLRKTIRFTDGALRTYYPGYDLSALATFITEELNSAATPD
jgi:hypothetical protein